jgi:hypothetical protein
MAHCFSRVSTVELDQSNHNPQSGCRFICHGADRDVVGLWSHVLGGTKLALTG